MKRLILSILALSVGCTTLPEYRRDGGTPEQQTRDMSECDTQVQKANTPMCEVPTAMNQCMGARGYNPVPGTGRWGAFCP
jgi:hypothetical protein